MGYVSLYVPSKVKSVTLSQSCVAVWLCDEQCSLNMLMLKIWREFQGVPRVLVLSTSCPVGAFIFRTLSRTLNQQADQQNDNYCPGRNFQYMLHTFGFLTFYPPGNPVRLTLNLVLYLSMELQICIAIIAMDTRDTRKNNKYSFYMILSRK